MRELIRRAPEPQLRLNNAPFHKCSFPDKQPWLELYHAGEGYLLRFPDLADFEVSKADFSVTCIPTPHIDDATTEHLYINHVLPLALSTSGQPVFHASSIEAESAALAFFGRSGRGKSTLATLFVTRGYRLLTDDSLVLKACEAGYQVMPGHPSIRLWDDSQKILESAGPKRAPSLTFSTKARFLTGPDLHYCDEPRPLRAAFFLGDGSAQDVELKPLEAAETIMEWAKNSFLLDVGDKSTLSAHFERTARVANTVPSYLLDYPRRFDSFDRVSTAIFKFLELEGLVA